MQECHEHFLCHCLSLWFKNGPCNRAGLTGKVVFLRLIRNSSICSNSVPLAWAGSCTSIWTTVPICPETQGQDVSGCDHTVLLQEGDTSLPSLLLPDPASSGGSPAMCCLCLNSRKTPGVFGDSFCTAAAPPGEGGIYFSPIGAGHRSGPAAGSWVLWCPSG